MREATAMPPMSLRNSLKILPQYGPECWGLSGSLRRQGLWIHDAQAPPPRLCSVTICPAPLESSRQGSEGWLTLDRAGELSIVAQNRVMFSAFQNSSESVPEWFSMEGLAAPVLNDFSGTFSCQQLCARRFSFSLFFNLEKLHYFVYRCFVCMYVCMCTMYMPGAHRNQKRPQHLLGPELQTVLSCPVGTGNQTQVL